MLKLDIHVDDVEDQLVANMNTDSATLADLAICERMLRRYLEQVIRLSNNLLDKDTTKGSPAGTREKVLKIVEQQTQEESL